MWRKIKAKMMPANPCMTSIVGITKHDMLWPTATSSACLAKHCAYHFQALQTKLLTCCLGGPEGPEGPASAAAAAAAAAGTFAAPAAAALFLLGFFAAALPSFAAAAFSDAADFA
jgi:hypothetical protein